jgi:hypothetical protein
MQLFKTTEISLKQYNMHPRNTVVTPSLVFTNIQTNFDEQNSFSIVENYLNWLNNQSIPKWVETLLHLYNDTGAIFNFNLPQLEGWHSFNSSIHSTNPIAEAEKYYLLLNNKFPVTRWQDLEGNLDYSQEKQFVENPNLLKTGWPLEIHIHSNSIQVYSINKKSKAVQDIKNILPEYINLEILISSRIIGEALSEYIENNSKNKIHFVSREEVGQIMPDVQGLQQLCLGSQSAPDTVIRNLLSKISKIEARIPDSILKFVQI